MNIFFTAAIRGGRANQPEYEMIVAALKKYGAVFSSHISDERISHFGETNLSAQDIFERERMALAKCDVVVAEVTTPSLGVGSLIAYASTAEKRVIALYRGEDMFQLSAIIKGNPHVQVHTYMEKSDIEKVLAEKFDR